MPTSPIKKPNHQASPLVEAWPKIRTPVALLVLAFLIGWMYRQSLHLLFLADDWGLLEGSIGTIHAAFAIDGTYHYNPIPRLIILAIHTIFGLSVTPYHVVALFLCWLGAVLVMLLGWELKQFAVGFCAAILFAAYGTHYEAAIWGVVAFWHTSATIIFILGLLGYARSHNDTLSPKDRRTSYIGFLLALVLAPFAHEQAFTLIVVCALYRLIVIEHNQSYSFAAIKKRFLGWLTDFSIPAVIALGYLAFKVWLGSQTVVPQAPGLTSSIGNLVRTLTLGFFQGFIPGLSYNQFAYLSLTWLNPKLIYLVLMAQVGLLLIVAFALRRKPVQLFLLLWTILQICAITVGLGGLSSRHLYLIAVPAALLWSCLAFDLIEFMPRLLTPLRLPKNTVRTLSLIPFVVVMIPLSGHGVVFTLIQVQAWADAGAHEQALLSTITRYAQENPTANQLYLVDLPDAVLAPTGEQIYLFRNAPAFMVRLTMPLRFQNVVAIRTNDDAPEARGYSTFATNDQLKQLHDNPQVILLQYDKQLRTLQTWQITPTIAGPGAIPSEVPTGELVQGTVVTQSFISTCSDLAGIDLLLATYARTNTHPVTVQLVEQTSGRVIVSQTIEGQTIRDNAWREFLFTPIADSSGKGYQIAISSTESQIGNAIAIWHSQADMYPNGEAKINGVSINADLVFHYRCLPK